MVQAVPFSSRLPYSCGSEVLRTVDGLLGVLPRAPYTEACADAIYPISYSNAILVE